jgi:transposase
MRGADEQTGALFSYLSPDALVPLDHPLRAIRPLVNAALLELSPKFEGLYASGGRLSIAPEKLLRALLLQAFYGVRSERQLMEQVTYNMLFRWFIGLSMDAPVWDVTVFTKNRERLLDGDVAVSFLLAIMGDPAVKRLYRKADGQPSRLCFMGHLLIENRHGLIVDVRTTHATGRAEREAAEAMILAATRGRRATLGADKAYDAAEHIARLRAIGVTPHVAQNTSGRRSAIDGRTTRHAGYAVSQRLRKRIEEPFGWIKAAAGLRKTRHRGLARVGWVITLTAAACNLVRLPKLLAATA